MKILFLADNFPPERNAQASRVYERACYWVRWGHEVTVITCAPNFPEGRLFDGYANRWRQAEWMDGIRVVRVKTWIAPNEGVVARILDFQSFMLSSFWAGLSEPRPDVVVATSPQFFAAVSGWALAKVKRAPFVMEVSDLWPDSIVAVGAMRHNPLLGGLERLELTLYREAARVVALTQSFKENMTRRGIAPAKIDVVQNGVDLARFSPRARDAGLASELGLPEDCLVAGYIGTLGMAHGLTNVLDAAGRMQGGPWRFLLVGPGAERAQLEAEARRRGLANVIFVHAQPKSRIAAYWSLLDVALVHLRSAPLFQTVIPSKIFEAMGMGLPVVLASPRGEASRIIEMTGAGVWVEPERPDELASALQRLSADPGERLRMAQRSLEAAPAHSRERQAREMMASLQAAAA